MHILKESKRFCCNVSCHDVAFHDFKNVDQPFQGPQESIELAMLNYLIQESRCAQLVPPEHSLITTLQDTMSRYLKDVKISTHKADKRDPEFLFYSGSEYTLNAYNVKPAVFDLFLAAGIAAYLVLIWFASQNMNVLFSSIKKYVQSPQKVKSQ